MNFIGNLIKKGYITSSQGRAIEIFTIGIIISFLVGLLDNVNVIINGGDVNRILFLSTFASTTGTAIVAGLQKYLRSLLPKE